MAMTAKEYLSQAMTIDREIESLRERCMRARSQAERLTSTLTGMPRGGSKHDWTDAVDRAIEYADRIAELMDDAIGRKMDIVNMIQSLADAEKRQLISLRYLDGRSWIQISQKMHMGRSTVWRYHVSALNDIERMLARRETDTVLKC